MKTMIKWSMALMMMIWGGVTFFCLAGEDDPANPLSLLSFCLLKAGAILSFYLWGRAIKYLSDRDLLPAALFPVIKEEQED